MLVSLLLAALAAAGVLAATIGYLPVWAQVMAGGVIVVSIANLLVLSLTGKDISSWSRNGR